tara:strand:- start:36 stop:155 length:120 start_codon:yes stop_codon:yes gene_type:complete
VVVVKGQQELHQMQQQILVVAEELEVQLDLHRVVMVDQV